ncbi:BGP_1a_G0049610.mRNA.1.CDS.1 [Saccharomyces cerevisiae]|nr:BGP_1a_G0049610.mRNA.1.CDS.1 [Saccharomyces cerevisiae]CAI7305850.1 BGP_1a_G0049610.mRNA.1.CDS.1 [Saccharomyces cerevisiae]
MLFEVFGEVLASYIVSSKTKGELAFPVNNAPPDSLVAIDCVVLFSRSAIGSCSGAKELIRSSALELSCSSSCGLPATDKPGSFHSGALSKSILSANEAVVSKSSLSFLSSFVDI